MVGTVISSGVRLDAPTGGRRLLHEVRASRSAFRIPEGSAGPVPVTRRGVLRQAAWPTIGFLSAGPCRAGHSARKADAVLARAAQLAGSSAPATPMTSPARARSKSSGGLKTLT